MPQQSKSSFDIEVFYDGDCPLCSREIRMLMRRDSKQRIIFTNIAASDFDSEAVGVTRAILMQRIHGRLPNGDLVHGVEVFRRLYSAIGWGPLVVLTRLPVLSHLLDLGYHIFARNRLKFTGRCTPQSCSIES